MIIKQRAHKWWCISLCLLFWLSVAHAAQTDLEEIWLSAQLNQLKQQQTLLFLKQTDGSLLMAASDWQQFRLKQPSTDVTTQYQNESYYHLNAIDGLSYQVNYQESTIQINANVNLFQSSQLIVANSNKGMSFESDMGATFNVELASNYYQSNINNHLFSDIAIFNPIGVLEAQTVLTEFDKTNRQLIRLDSTFKKDLAQQAQTLILGDSNTTDVGLGGVRFAGLKWSTNSSLEPNVVKTPLLSMQGVAKTPSSVDIFINNLRSSSQKVETGAFTVDKIPVVSGNGELRMVITDMFGQEQVITQSYYMNPELLDIGVAEFSYELGTIRENFGIDNSNYGQGVFISSYRQGLKSNLTLEAHTQLLRQQQNLALGSAFVSPYLGAMRVNLAASYALNEIGYAWLMAHNYQGRNWTFGWQGQHYDENFQSLTNYRSLTKINQRWQAYANASVAEWGSIGLNYIYQDDNKQNTQLLVASFNRKLWSGTINLAYSHDFNTNNDSNIKLTLSMPLMAKHNLNASYLPQNNQYSMALRRSLPAGDGIGYGVNLESVQGLMHYQADISLQNSFVNAQLRMAKNSQQNTGFNTSLRSGIAWLNKDWYLSRNIDRSFAVVKTDNYANIGIYRQNQLVGKTNKQGLFLVTGLEPYINNDIRLNTSDLPFDAQLDSEVISIRPAYKSGVFKAFPIKRAYGATFTLLLDNSQLAPAGMEIFKEGGEVFSVGFNGEVYVTGLTAKNRFTGEWKGQKCQIEVDFELTDDTLPDLGTFICKGVRP